MYMDAFGKDGTRITENLDFVAPGSEGRGRITS